MLYNVFFSSFLLMFITFSIYDSTLQHVNYMLPFFSWKKALNAQIS